MKKAEYLSRLREELQSRTGAVFKAKTIKEGDLILLEISAKDFKQNVDWPLNERNEVPNAEKRLFITVDIICELIHKNISLGITQNLENIANICSRYLLENNSLRISRIDLKTKCDKNVLLKMSSYVFIDRMSGYFKTLLALSSQPGQYVLLAHELSTGIILRSCILDCLIINAWIRDKSRNQKFIRDMVVSSFLIVPAGVSQDIKLEFEIIANFFNVGLKRKINEKKKDQIKADTSIGKIFEHLKGAPNIKKQYELYSYYSKFEHFSFVPYLIKKTPYAKMAMIGDALHFIKFTLDQLL